ncbi:bifunctional diguanylate cyclase/phosphodiesterase [Rhizobium sp. LCM 4573]|uniref:putative bifunctional diguanylate cyclase/phosphodiesterase n=1 Tax=Rhizobium sp. LCM 4573 TaxID=1848291 RepID=UPI0008DA65FD|nr:EAL domain-containing protein [Rhizobium sp. LCM 4573]OHV79012.1 diguanylate cyclase [Rhizobium sp. LCM 4573]
MKHIFAETVETDLQKTSPRPTAGELRDLYRRDGEAARRTATRHGLWIAIIIYVLFWAADIVLTPDVAIYTVATRLTVGGLALAVIEAQVRFGVGITWLNRTCAVALVMGYAAWVLPTLQTAYTESLSYYMIFGAIFMMGANLFFSFRFSLSVATSGAVLAIFLASLPAFWPSDNYAFAFATFYVSCFIFTSYVNWKLNEERYNVFLNALEAKTQQREANERGEALLRMSNTDYLTGLENRRAVDQRLRYYWNEWQGNGRGFAAILVDVDFFKKYNDGYGHQEGDRCLVDVATTIKQAIEPYGGSIGRYGGEEFIVLAQIDSREEVAALAEGIRFTVEQLRVHHKERRDGTSVVTVSVGAAFTRDQAGAKLEKIIHEADRALYSAKASGRNCVRLFDPNDPNNSDETENIAALLKIAVDQGLVSLVYQPIEDMVSGRRDAVEALMRLKTLDGVAVPPSLFIPIAERTGLITDLGRWVIRTVCLDLLAENHVEVASVNVSPIQLKMPGFAASVAAILYETGVSGSRLALEITEGLEMEMHSDVLRCISDLKTLGIQIWLDDFGTGFAGLSWLRLIEFDIVKIDRSFLHDGSAPRGRAMLQDIVDLVRNRGPKILVEGVETEGQLALVRELRIDYAQGYHVGHPAPVQDFRKTAKAARPRHRKAS